MCFVNTYPLDSDCTYSVDNVVHPFKPLGPDCPERSGSPEELGTVPFYGMNMIGSDSRSTKGLIPQLYGVTFNRVK